MTVDHTYIVPRERSGGRPPPHRPSGGIGRAVQSEPSVYPAVEEKGELARVISSALRGNRQDPARCVEP